MVAVCLQRWGGWTYGMGQGRGARMGMREERILGCMQDAGGLDV